MLDADDLAQGNEPPAADQHRGECTPPELAADALWMEMPASGKLGRAEEVFVLALDWRATLTGVARTTGLDGFGDRF